MKILVVSPKFYPIVGGGETFALHSVEQLHSKGHNVSVAVEPHHDRRPEAYDYAVYEIQGLSDMWLDTVKAADGLYRIIKQICPDIIHVHGYFGLLAVSLANMDNIPTVVSIHSTPVWGERIIGGMRGFEQELLYARKIIKFSAPIYLTAANDVYARAAKKIAREPTKVQVFPYPLPSHYFDNHDVNKYRSELGLEKSDILITVPSRIIERKGIREAVEAISLLPEEYKLCLPCAVTPLDKKYWSSIVVSQAFVKIRHRIYIPQLPILPDKMPELYAATDIVVMPSYYEGAPVATTEAMASRRPFIGADCQGINDFIKNGENGVLFPKKSVKLIAETIERTWSDKRLQKIIVDRAYRDVQKINWEYQLPKLIKLYEDAINS